MPYVQNIITNEAGLKFCLEKTGLIIGHKDRPVDILLPMFCVGQDACLDSGITHKLQPTFIDRAPRKNPPFPLQILVTKATTAKKHSNDDEKCCHNGMRMIIMAWETFGGSASETRIMIRKIAIHHANKQN
jgi:hypothetical protein